MYVGTVRTVVVYLSALPRCLCARPPACDPCRTNGRSAVTLSRVSQRLPVTVPMRAAVCHRSACLPSHPRCCTSTRRRSLALQLSILCMAESSRRLATTARRGGVRASAARVVASAANNERVISWHAGRRVLAKRRESRVRDSTTSMCWCRDAALYVLTCRLARVHARCQQDACSTLTAVLKSVWPFRARLLYKCQWDLQYYGNYLPQRQTLESHRVSEPSCESSSARKVCLEAL